ncbi:lytic murein transglycosylase [Hasllibacter halocynthiae]|uniref:Lytic murein transglycosylase n=1 Tax=Hasllibacter halocynthiae TaxID=595589 RepID=A0A2T0X7U0_9RHOB|nr:lytic murein transglycosylase [Hasllibacter halocynthiae]PRY95021.1 lytic murein transglycosylase [Hasllibacter halocynthiae]
MPNRRLFVLSGLALAGCGGGGVPASAPPAAQARFVAVPNAGWDAWVAAYRDRAAARGIPAATIDAAFRGAGFLPEVIERDRNQAEFSRSFEDYLQLVASEQRVREGRAAFARRERTLRAVEARYGVPAEVLAAIWGVESRYGTRRGTVPVISAVSTLAYDGRRGAFFERQLDAALRILGAGDVSPDRMVGSWAGAMGHTQFIPTSFRQSAVDFDGDGRRDIWGADPADALATSANYLAQAGWRRGAPIASEAASGLRPDPGGPAFATGPNFRTIKRYNNSDNYALAVAYLAGRIAGGGPLGTAFGPDRFGLTLEDRIALQERLNAAGFDAGNADGVIGDGTRAAIEAFQRSRGLAATGDPSPVLLGALAG